MKNVTLTSILVTSMITSPALDAAVIAAWDFNEDPLVADSSTAFTFPDADAGSQAATASLVVTPGTGSSDPLEVNNEGDALNDTWNTPAEAGNAIGFLHGSRNDGATALASFDASSITNAISLSFAFEVAHGDGVNQYQPSYSTNGIDWTDIGSAVTISDVGSWTLQTIDFGTVLSGASTAYIRITMGDGGAVWNEEHQSNLDNIAITAVPEPSTFALAFGLLALGGVMLRRRLKR